MSKPVTKREIAAWHAFAAPAYNREGPEIPKARAPSRNLEHKEQCAVIDWWRSAHKGFGLPEFALFAIPNGGSRHMLTAVRLKAEGVRSGIPDLFLAVVRGRNGGLWCEMKSSTGVLSDSQFVVTNYLQDAGYIVIVCRSSVAAIEAITNYLKG